MREHTCDFDEALVEGYCPGSPDPNVHEISDKDLRESFLENDGITPGIGFG